MSGRIILRGSLELLSPLHIGSGTDDNSDLDIALDSDQRPYIPGTSVAGVLLDHLSSAEASVQKYITAAFGKTDNGVAAQSFLEISDCCLTGTPPDIEIRDGIKINHKTGLTEDKAKYDFEIVPKGALFSFKVETSFEEENRKWLQILFNTIKYELEQSKPRFGAKTNSGLGKVILKKGKIHFYDFAQKDALLRYLKREDGFSPEETARYEIQRDEFIIDAWFDLKTSLLSRSYSKSPDAPDTTHIKSGNSFVQQGTSTKGAVSSRAERILNTLFKDKRAEYLFKDLFGFVNTKALNEKDANAKISRIRIDETVIAPSKIAAEVQTRIKVDRFTGGTVDGALFDSMPLFRKNKTLENKEKVLNLTMTIFNASDADKGLLLLILKDLWTADLALDGGKGIGQGTLEGVCATIIDQNNKTRINVEDPAQIASPDKEKLQTYVTALNNFEVQHD